MRTVKLVVIGNSGVGKTSFRSQVRMIRTLFFLSSLITTITKYVSGRFSTGYRATIGADFIAKTLPHHSDAEESVTLQIWVRPSPSLSLPHSRDHRIPLDKSAFHHSQLPSSAARMPPFSCSTSISPRRCMPSPDGGLSFVPAHRSPMRTWKNTALW
jgi:hypothetical protein